MSSVLKDNSCVETGRVDLLIDFDQHFAQDFLYRYLNVSINS